MIQTLKLDPDTRTEEEIKIRRASIQGAHEGIKRVIEEEVDFFRNLLRKIKCKT